MVVKVFIELCVIKQIIGVDLLRIIVFYCFLTISEKKLITALEKMKKCMFELTFESFKIIIYIILNRKITSMWIIRFDTAI